MNLPEKLFVLILCCKLIVCTGHFTIIGSQFLSPNGKYIVAITSTNFDNLDVPILEVAIKSSNGVWSAQNITITKEKTQSLEFNTIGIPYNDYNLAVTCIKGMKYSRNVRLRMTEHLQTFVQTDKVIYKPSDEVKIRVLFLNENLKPLNVTNVQIYITDGAENRVKQFNDVAITKGVFQDTLQLSDSPILGNWNVGVIVNNEKKSKKYFEVAEYTLQNFEVTLDVNFDELQINATVVAKHTFGTMAKGNATVTAQVKNYNISKTIEVHGSKTVEFDLKNDLNIKENTTLTVKLLATFIDELTHNVQNVTADVQLHAAPYEVIIVAPKSRKFKPGLPLKLKSVVRSRQNNEPISDGRNPVIFIINFPGKPGPMLQLPNGRYGRGANFTSYSKVFEATSKNGSFEVDIPTEAYVDRLNIIATYLEISKCEINLKSVPSSIGQFVTITSMTETPKLVENITVNILSTTNFTKFSYLLLTKNRGVIASYTNQVPSTRNHTFQFAPTHDVESKTQLIVFYIMDNGKVIFDSLNIEFVELRNSVDIQISDTSSVSPGSSININVTSNQNSLVGLLCVDRSVLLLKKTNKIIESQIFDKTNEVKSNFKIFFIINTARADVVTFSGDGHEVPFIRDDDSFTNDEPRVRKDFSESWLFETLNFGIKQTSEVISRTVPDTITSWIVIAFSIDPIKGLAMTKEFTKFSVTEPLFFISTDLPYSIKCNESVSILISVFNYDETNQDAEVTLYNEDSAFEFVHPGEMKLRSKTNKLEVNAGDRAVTQFTIRATNIGSIKIKVVATTLTSTDGDAIERELLVEPEGITQYKNIPIFVDLRNKKNFSADLRIVLPENVIENSIKVEASLIGDVLGLPIGNVQKLIKLPDGCGEQNMINFVPNIVVLDYLTAVKKLTPEINRTAIQFLETGYQKQLKFKHDDGSFSVWGNKDERGSTWLTAFVAKSFRQADKYILIDADIIAKALNFLSKTQSENGSFVEVGYIFQKDIQGGVSNEIALTAYTLITFLENQDFVQTYKPTIDKALAFMSNYYNNITDNYSLTIATYAMNLANHSLQRDLLSKLETNAKTENGMMFWVNDDSEVEDQPSSLDIEMTAYALQAFLQADRFVDSARIMKWLVSQRNKNGGFICTQDTVVGLQALSKVAVQMYSENIQMTVEVDDQENKFLLKLNKTNALIRQKRSLPSTARCFKIIAEGNGFGIFQISYQYNIRDEVIHKFNITTEQKPTVDKKTWRLAVCTNFIADEKTKSSNMAYMQVSFPSGWIFNKDFLNNLRETKEIKLEPIIAADGSVTVYFEYLTEESVCLNFMVSQKHRVKANGGTSPIAYIHVHDFYDLRRYGVTSYMLPMLP